MSTDADYWRDRCSQAETKAELLQDQLDAAKLDLKEATEIIDGFLREAKTREEPKERSKP